MFGRQCRERRFPFLDWPALLAEANRIDLFLFLDKPAFCLLEACRTDFDFLAEASCVDFFLLRSMLRFCAIFLLMRGLADFTRLLSDPANCRFFNFDTPFLESPLPAADFLFWADNKLP